MNGDNLIKMANRIGDFFETMPDRPEALDGAAEHIGRFWAPRMRLQILASLDTGESAELSPFMREALSNARERLTPATA
ncbi:MAG: formate dehydrogenase subunit delta [Janthinobacterium lividum]